MVLNSVRTSFRYFFVSVARAEFSAKLQAVIGNWSTLELSVSSKYTAASFLCSEVSNVCVRACVRACMRCVRACMRCVRRCVCVTDIIMIVRVMVETDIIIAIIMVVAKPQCNYTSCKWEVLHLKAKYNHR